MKKLFVGLVLASSLLFGAQGDHKAEITATVGGMTSEGNLDMEDSLVYGLRFGTYIEDTFFDMLEFGIERADSVDYENTNKDTDINRFFVNIVKEYNLNKDFALYGLAGVGYENIRTPLLDNDDDGFFNYGVGLKYWVNDDFALKAEVRHAISFEDQHNKLFYTLGFSIPLGKKVQEAPVRQEPIAQPVKVEPVVEPKPQPVVVMVKDNDLDKDGVVNEQDKCPNTPVGKVVQADGCIKIIRLHVNFDFDKSNIKKSEMQKINEVIEFMRENPSYKVELDGHTDSQGSEKYNLALGQRRAKAVANVLIQNGIASNKIMTQSYGESQPIASNKTQAGRAENRRVDTHFDK